MFVRGDLFHTESSSLSPSILWILLSPIALYEAQGLFSNPTGLVFNLILDLIILI